MAIRTISVTARPDEAQLDAAQVMVERLLRDWIGTHFVPLAVAGLWGNATLAGLPPETGSVWNGVPLWTGEVADRSVLTMLPDPDWSFRDSLLAQLPDGEYGCTLRGGLQHRPTLPEPDSGWYVRAKIRGSDDYPPQLWELAHVRIEWSRIDHYVGVWFPLAGYPITHAIPPETVDSAVGRSACSDVVQENQRELFTWIARLPYDLRWRGPTEWEVNADDALFDDDAMALAEWMQRLQTGAV